ncbi:MAG: ferric reductase-like transmembrane domain-containing protein [Azonexus sp.]
MPHTPRLVLLTALLVGLPTYWALPEGLSDWRSVAIVSGWLGCGLLLANLLFAIREPWLARQLGGLENMYRWHHWLGLAAYLVLLCHPLALALDAWSEHPGQAWAVLAPLQQGWPGWLGWLSLLCLMIGMGSALMPGTAYSTWRWLHGLLALAILLSVGHLFALGLDFPLLWSPVLALAFILWRIIRADCGVAAKPFVVSEVCSPGKDIVEVHLTPLAHPIEARPGQFVLAAFFDGPHFQGCREFHPFTISALGSDGELALGIKALGDCTHHLQSLEPGVRARIQGPFGAFLSEPASGPALWIAGGIGITPFLARLRAGPPVHPVRLVYLYRSGPDAAYLDELRRYEQTWADFSLTARESGNAPPSFADILPVPDAWRHWHCYLCGPPGLVVSAVNYLSGQGVPGRQIHFERFDFR